MTRRHILLIAFIPLLLFAAWHYLSPARQLRSAQKQLLTAISEKDAKACMKLIHPDYSDQWTFTASDWPAILQDLRTLSPILEITAVDPRYETDQGVVDTGLKAIAGGGPGSDTIESRAVRAKEPTRFLWKRQPWRPWSWQLVSIQNPDIDIPSDYRPGRFSSVPSF